MALLYGANFTFLFRIVKKNKHCDWVVFQISSLHVFLESFDQGQKSFSSPRLALYYNVAVGPRFTAIFTAVTSTANIGLNAIVLHGPTLWC